MTLAAYAEHLDQTEQMAIDRARQVVADFESIAGRVPVGALGRVASMYLDVMHEQLAMRRPVHPFKRAWDACA